MEEEQEQKLQRRSIFEVFLHLPVKTLLRCRCLSRWHRSAIDHPVFSPLYGLISTRHETRSRSLFLQFSLHPRAAPLEFCTFSPPYYPGQPVLGRSCVVSGSCFGLLCVASSPFDVCLWNPKTRTHRHLIPPPNYEHHDGDDVCRLVNFGLGRDGDRDSKVVRLVFSFSPEDRTFNGEASLYSVVTDTWQKLDFQMTWGAENLGKKRMADKEFQSESRRSGVSVSDGIKWLVKYHGFPKGMQQFTIVSLDLNTNDFTTEPLPQYLMEGRNPESLFDIHIWPLCLSYCLSLDFRTEHRQVVIWRKQRRRWDKLVTVDSLCDQVKPLYFSTDFKKLMLQMDWKLVWYDLQTNDLCECIHSRYNPSMYEVTPYTDSCVLIDGLGRCSNL